MVKVHGFESGEKKTRKKLEAKKIKTKRHLFALNQKQRTELLALAKCNIKHYLIIKLALESGLRVSEIANLTVPELDFTNCRIELASKKGGDYNLAFTTKTPSSQRIIVLDSHLMDNLSSFVGARKTGYVFESQVKSKERKNRYNRNSIINMINFYAKQCKSIGQTIGAHCLRRTYASYLAENQEKIGIIQKQLGHESITTTMRYLHDIHSEKDYENTRKILRKMNK